MWSKMQLLLAGTALAGSDSTPCGAFTRFSEPGFETCVDEMCSKIKIECPEGYTSSFENSIKCKGGEWNGLDENIMVTCDMDYKPCKSGTIFVDFLSW